MNALSNTSSPKTTRDVLDVLRTQGALSERAADSIKQSGATYEQINELLLSQHSVRPEQLARAWGVVLGIPFVALKGRRIPLEVISRVDQEIAKKYRMVVYEADGTHLKLALSNPARVREDMNEVLSAVRSSKGFDIKLAVATDRDIEDALRWYKGGAHRAGSTTPYSVLASINLLLRTIPYSVLAKFPPEVAAKYQMVVFANPAPQTIRVAALHPTNPAVQDVLGFIEKKNSIGIELFQATKEGIQHALEGYINQQGVEPEIVRISAPQHTDKIPLTQSNATSSTPSSSPSEQASAPPVKKSAPVEETPAGVVAIKTAEISQVVSTSSASVEDVESMEAHNLDTFVKEKLTDVNDLAQVVRKGFIPQTVAAIIVLAIAQRASDIHIEPLREYVRLRYRVDGILREVVRFPAELQAPVISRIKILSKLKIDEQRIPQDGRFDVTYQGKEVDLRVSTLPTVHGEKVVMRVLDKSEGIMTLEKLGMSGQSFERVKRNIVKPYGIILSTGPTGSGKSTTLYAILARISTTQVNVITLEDPVEYEIPGVNQTQVKPKIGFSFAEGLRSVVRQDPNIIMVGEIRDGETAQMATHAALTGHLVLTTLHTNDAAGALPRLVNMGVEPFLITTSINAIVAQRLVRKICPTCKEKITVPATVQAELLKELGTLKHPEPAFYRGKGCKECSEGYRGRIGIFEVLEMSDAVEQLAVQRAPASRIQEAAVKEGMITIKQDGILKVFDGLTTLDEVLRVTQSE